MLILVEGGDAVGKTYLCNKLVKELPGATLIHRGPPQGNIFDEYEGSLDFYRPMRGQNVVCDRWHLGETIYGPLLRGSSRLDDVQLRHVEMYLQSRGALLVLLDEEDEIVAKRIHGDDEQLINVLQSSVVLAKYRQLNTALNTVHDRNTSFIKAWACHLEYRAARLNKWPSYVGPVKPDILLLGEVNPHPEIHTAALTPYAGRCGHYLLQAVANLDVGLGNALEGPVRDLWTALNRPQVVALGRSAQKVCQAENVPHGTVVHPQWARRFKAGQQDIYGGLIDAAAHTREDLIKWQ